MIATLAGKITHKDQNGVVVEVQGVGFEVVIPLSTYQSLPEAGVEVRLFTYLHVREDILKLFGFATDEERQIFKLLISISGVGPSTGMSILSGMSVRELKRAIMYEDFKSLSAVPGIGKKTAQRLIVDLKEKINTVAVPVDAARQEPADKDLRMFNDAMGALTSLGIKPQAARMAIDKVIKEEGREKLTVQELIRKAIKYASQYGT
jgi:Holliday junction DNA helicase RuvA